jgi:hypothetical protein
MQNGIILLITSKKYPQTHTKWQKSVQNGRIMLKIAKISINILRPHAKRCKWQKSVKI